MDSRIPDIKQKAPDFTVVTESGNRFTLSQSLAQSEYLMLIFYRGHW